MDLNDEHPALPEDGYADYWFQRGLLCEKQENQRGLTVNGYIAKEALGQLLVTNNDGLTDKNNVLSSVFGLAIGYSKFVPLYVRLAVAWDIIRPKRVERWIEHE